MYKKILVPLDGSELAEQILPLVIPLATEQQAELVLVRVPDVPDAESLTPETPRAMREHAEHDAARYLTRLGRDLRATGLHVQTQIRNGDAIYSTLLDTANEVGADLIAMSTHGRSGLAQLVMGSVADDVVRHATLPILLIRPQPTRVTVRGNNRPAHALGSSK
jgi:nucleotide-binding universal stress UspA family protein